MRALAVAAIAGCPVFPSQQPVEPACRRQARARPVGRDRPQHRARGHDPPRLRLRPLRGAPDRHPVHGGLQDPEALEGPLRVRRRVRSRPVPPARSAEDRGRVRPPRPARPARHVQALRAVRGRARAAAPGRPAAARSSTCARTSCARRAGRARTPPAWRSFPASPATTRSPRARSATRCASRSRAPARAFVFPARHFASDLTDPDLPAMGQRLRLKASVKLDRLPKQARIVATALQRYGMLVADNGSDWFVSGAPDPGWDDDDLARARGSAQGQRLRGRSVNGLAALEHRRRTSPAAARGSPASWRPAGDRGSRSGWSSSGLRRTPWRPGPCRARPAGRRARWPCAASRRRRPSGRRPSRARPRRGPAGRIAPRSISSVALADVDLRPLRARPPRREALQVVGLVDGLACPSIQPKQSATSTASAWTTVGMPVPFLAILIQRPSLVAWCSSSQASKSCLDANGKTG